MTENSTRTILALTVLDTEIGAAVTPVGVLGIEGHTIVASWVPGADTADWAARVASLADAADKAAMVEDWDERSNGIAWAMQPLASDCPGDLRTAVEDALDMLMATPG